jgi:hypothetical protein
MSQVVLTGYTPSVMADERDELIAALRQLIAFTEGLLTLNERLLRAYDTDARPSSEELAAMGDGVVRWREQLEASSNGSRRQQFSATSRCDSSNGERRGDERRTRQQTPAKSASSHFARWLGSQGWSRGSRG